MALKIVWTPQAEAGLRKLLIYLEEHWTSKEILSLEMKLEALLKQISLQPQLFPGTGKIPYTHKALVDKNNYIIYRRHLSHNIIEIINFRGTKQHPLEEK